MLKFGNSFSEAWPRISCHSLAVAFFGWRGASLIVAKEVTEEAPLHVARATASKSAGVYGSGREEQETSAASGDSDSQLLASATHHIEPSRLNEAL